MPYDIWGNWTGDDNSSQDMPQPSYDIWGNQTSGSGWGGGGSQNQSYNPNYYDDFFNNSLSDYQDQNQNQYQQDAQDYLGNVFGYLGNVVNSTTKAISDYYNQLLQQGADANAPSVDEVSQAGKDYYQNLYDATLPSMGETRRAGQDYYNQEYLNQYDSQAPSMDETSRFSQDYWDGQQQAYNQQRQAYQDYQAQELYNSQVPSVDESSRATDSYYQNTYDASLPSMGETRQAGLDYYAQEYQNLYDSQQPSMDETGRAYADYARQQQEYDNYYKNALGKDYGTSRAFGGNADWGNTDPLLLTGNGTPAWSEQDARMRPTLPYEQGYDPQVGSQANPANLFGYRQPTKDFGEDYGGTLNTMAGIGSWGPFGALGQAIGNFGQDAQKGTFTENISPSLYAKMQARPKTPIESMDEYLNRIGATPEERAQYHPAPGLVQSAVQTANDVAPFLPYAAAPAIMTAMNVGGSAATGLAGADLGPISDAAKAGIDLTENYLSPFWNGSWYSMSQDLANGRIPGSSLVGNAVNATFNGEQWRQQLESQLRTLAQQKHDEAIKAGYTEEQAQQAAKDFYEKNASNNLRAAMAPAEAWKEQQAPIVQFGLDWFNPIANKVQDYALTGHVNPEHIYKTEMVEPQGGGKPVPVLGDNYRYDPVGLAARGMDMLGNLAPMRLAGNVARPFTSVYNDTVGQTIGDALQSKEQRLVQWNDTSLSLIPKLADIAKASGEDLATTTSRFIDDPNFRQQLGFWGEDAKVGNEVAQSLAVLRAKGVFSELGLDKPNNVTVAVNNPPAGRDVNGWKLSPEGERVSQEFQKQGYTPEEADRMAVLDDAGRQAYLQRTGIDQSGQLEVRAGDPNNPDPTALYQKAQPQEGEGLPEPAKQTGKDKELPRTRPVYVDKSPEQEKAGSGLDLWENRDDPKQQADYLKQTKQFPDSPFDKDGKGVDKVGRFLRNQTEQIYNGVHPVDSRGRMDRFKEATKPVLRRLLALNGGTGKSWYQEDWKKAIDYLADYLFPEFKTDDNAVKVFKLLTGLDSQAEGVTMNLLKAIHAYEQFTRSGKIPTRKLPNTVKDLPEPLQTVLGKYDTTTTTKTTSKPKAKKEKTAKADQSLGEMPKEGDPWATEGEKLPETRQQRYLRVRAAMMKMGTWVEKFTRKDDGPATFGLATGNHIKLQHLIDNFFGGDVNAAVEWLTTKHTYDEIAPMLDVYDTLQNRKSKEGDVRKDIESDKRIYELMHPGEDTSGYQGYSYGSVIFGPKIGNFIANLMGAPDRATKDMWFTRTWRRVMGENTGGPKAEYLHQPTDGEIAEMDQAMAELVNELRAEGIDPEVMNLPNAQALLWFYEQQLWSAIGQKSASESYGTVMEKVMHNILTKTDINYQRPLPTPDPNYQNAGHKVNYGAYPDTTEEAAWLSQFTGHAGKTPEEKLASRQAYMDRKLNNTFNGLPTKGMLGTEVEPGSNSFSSKLFPSLTDRSVVSADEATKITKQATNSIVNHLMQYFTPDELQVVSKSYGAGGYGEYTNASGQIQLWGRKEAIQQFAAMYGIMAGQDQVAYSRPTAAGDIQNIQFMIEGSTIGQQNLEVAKKISKAGKPVGKNTYDLELDQYASLWNRMTEIMPELKDMGYAQVPDGVGIRISAFGMDPALFPAFRDKVDAALNQALDEMFTPAGGEVTYKTGVFQSEGGLIPEVPNNWKEQPNGEAYRGDLLTRRPDLQGALDGWTAQGRQYYEDAWRKTVGDNAAGVNRLDSWRLKNGVDLRLAPYPTTSAKTPLFQKVGDTGEILGSYQPKDAATGKSVMELYPNRTNLTPLHELGHHFEATYMTPLDRRIVSDAYNIDPNNWSVKDKERFADDFVQYAKDGKAPTPELKGVFNKLKVWIANAYKAFFGDSRDRLDPQVRKAISRMLGQGLPGGYRSQLPEPTYTATTAKGVDVSKQYAQYKAGENASVYGSKKNALDLYKDQKGAVEKWASLTPDQLLTGLQDVNALRSGKYRLDEFGQQKPVEILGEFGAAGKIARGPQGFSDYMVDTMLNSVGRFFRDPFGNGLKSVVEGYGIFNSKARRAEVERLGIRTPELGGSISHDSSKQGEDGLFYGKDQNPLYKGGKFAAQWPGALFGLTVLTPLNKAGVKWAGTGATAINKSVENLESASKQNVFDRAATKGYYQELNRSRRDLIQEARQHPVMRQLLDAGILSEDQLHDIVSGKLSTGDVKKLLTQQYHLQNYNPTVTKQRDLLDPSVNPHSYVRDMFDALPPDTKPGDPAFQQAEQQARAQVDTGTWAAIDAEVQAIRAAGGDPAFAASIKYPAYMPATMDNWQAGEEPHFAARYGSLPKPQPQTLWNRVSSAKPVKIGNSGLNSISQLRKLSKQFMTASDPMRATLIDHFQRADEALRQASGNTYKLDFGTMEPVNIKTGAFLSTEVGKNTRPPITPAPNQLVDPVERQRLIDVSEKVFGPGSQAVLDMAQSMKNIEARLGDLGQKPWASMHPAEQQLAISIVSRELGYPDPTSARQVYGLSMEQRKAAHDYIDMLKADATDREQRAGTLNPGLPGTTDKNVPEAIDWLRNQQAIMVNRARLAGERAGKAEIDRIYFDYRNKNRLDQALTNWVPFQFWTRKNIAYLFQHFAENPTHLAALLNFYNAMQQENERLGVPPYASAYLKLWQNADGSYQMLNFAPFMPFNFGEGDLPLLTVQPDQDRAPKAFKTWNERPLAETLLGSDQYNTKGQYTGRNLGFLGQFFRANPAVAIAGRSGATDQLFDALGIQQTLANYLGDNSQNHFGDDTNEGFNLVPSRGITASLAAATGTTDTLRKIAKGFGIDMLDLDLEGPQNEVLGRIRKALEKLDTVTPDYEKIYGKPDTKFEREIMLKVADGTLTKDQGYSLIAEFKQGRLSPSGAKILDSIQSGDLGRYALSLTGFSTVQVNTPRDQLAAKLWQMYGEVANQPGYYYQGSPSQLLAKPGQVPQGKYVKGPKDKFFDDHPEASILFGSRSSASELEQQVKDDETYKKLDQLYKDRKTIGSAEYYKRMDALQQENPAYFKAQQDRERGKSELPPATALKQGEQLSRPDQYDPKAMEGQRKFDLSTEQYKNIDKGRLQELYKQASELRDKGDTAGADKILNGKEYQDLYRAQTAYIKNNPDWFKQYSDNSEQRYGTEPKTVAERDQASKTADYRNIDSGLVKQLRQQAEDAKAKGDLDTYNKILNSKQYQDAYRAQTEFIRNNPAWFTAYSQGIAQKYGDDPATLSEREMTQLKNDYYQLGGDKFDQMSKQAKALTDAGDKAGASKIYNDPYFKQVEQAQELFRQQHPDLAAQMDAEYEKKNGKPPKSAEQKAADNTYYGLLDQFNAIGGSRYDALSKQLNDAIAKGDKKAQSAVYNDPYYKQVQATRSQFKNDHKEWALQYQQYNDEKYPKTPEEKAAAEKKAAASTDKYGDTIYGSNNLPTPTYSSGSSKSSGGSSKSYYSSGSKSSSSSKSYYPTSTSSKSSSSKSTAGFNTKSSTTSSGLPTPAATSNAPTGLKLPSMSPTYAATKGWTLRKVYQQDYQSAKRDALERMKSEPGVISLPMYQSGSGYTMFSKRLADMSSSDLNILDRWIAAIQVLDPEYAKYVTQSIATLANSVYNKSGSSKANTTGSSGSVFTKPASTTTTKKKSGSALPTPTRKRVDGNAWWQKYYLP